MTVTILLDPFETQSGRQVLHVKNQRDYTNACRVLDDALAAKEKLVVAVHNRAMVTWFDHYLDRHHVTLRSCDPCEMLAERLGTAITDIPIEIREDPGILVSEQVISRAGRSSLGMGQDVLAWLLGVTLEPIWGTQNLISGKQLGELLESCITRAEAKIPPTFLALRRTRVQNWIRSSPYANILRWLFEGTPGKRALALLLYALVSKYPEHVRAEALEFSGLWSELSQLQDLAEAAAVVPKKLPASMTIPGPFEDVIRAHLEETLEEKSLDNVVPWISGLLRVERDAIREHLCLHASSIDASWEDALKQLDSQFSRASADASFLVFLREHFPVPEAGILEDQASWPVVSSWFEQDYLPFYVWSRSVGKVEESERAARGFEQWLVNNYDKLARTDAYAPFAVRSTLTSLVTRMPTLLVVADALSWEYSRRLRSSLLRHEISHARLTIHITGLPTLTPVAKPALLRGQLPGQIDLKEQGSPYYAGLLAEMLGLSASDIGCASSAEQELSTLMGSRKRVYLYLFNELDHALHRQLSLDARHMHLDRWVEQLASEIARARDAFYSRYHDHLAVVIASDHGYTEVPAANTVLIQEPPAAASGTSHRRVAYFPSGATPDSQELARIINVSSHQACLVASGYSCYQGRPKGATHGGLTPQEVLVPLVVLDPSDEVTYRDPDFAISGEILRGKTRNPITIQIWNPNGMAIKIMTLRLRRITIDNELPVHFESTSRVTIRAQFDASGIREELFTISGYCEAEEGGRRHSTEVSHTVKTIGAAVTDTDFEDAFDV